MVDGEWKFNRGSMKAKMKVKSPMELEFEITGTQADAEEWLNKAIVFLATIPTDRVNLKVTLAEVQIRGQE
jgi:hypothetical protein